jgi:E3 ubiquitin-protein ligase RGLG
MAAPSLFSSAHSPPSASRGYATTVLSAVDELSALRAENRHLKDLLQACSCANYAHERAELLESVASLRSAQGLLRSANDDLQQQLGLSRAEVAAARAEGAVALQAAVAAANADAAQALHRKTLELSRSAAAAAEEGDDASSWRAEAARLRERLRSVEAGAAASVEKCAAIAVEKVRDAEVRAAKAQRSLEEVLTQQQAAKAQLAEATTAFLELQAREETRAARAADELAEALGVVQKQHAAVLEQRLGDAGAATERALQDMEASLTSAHVKALAQLKASHDEALAQARAAHAGESLFSRGGDGGGDGDSSSGGSSGGDGVAGQYPLPVPPSAGAAASAFQAVAPRLLAARGGAPPPLLPDAPAPFVTQLAQLKKPPPRPEADAELEIAPSRAPIASLKAGLRPLDAAHELEILPSRAPIASLKANLRPPPPKAEPPEPAAPQRVPAVAVSLRPAPPRASSLEPARAQAAVWQAERAMAAARKEEEAAAVAAAAAAALQQPPQQSTTPPIEEDGAEKGGGGEGGGGGGENAGDGGVSPAPLPTLAAFCDTLRAAGLRSSQLCIFVDCTKSNLTNGSTSYGGRSLHDTSDPANPNPYQEVISCITSALAPFDADGDVPVFGFGDISTADKKVFPFRPSKPAGGPLRAYTDGIGTTKLAGPTCFAPAIKRAIELYRAAKKKEMLICVIIADGQVTNPTESDKAVLEACKFPISIVTVGVGDGPWGNLERMCRKIVGQKWDNFRCACSCGPATFRCSSGTLFTLRCVNRPPIPPLPHTHSSFSSIFPGSLAWKGCVSERLLLGKRCLRRSLWTC